jgi:hypothetical protein
MAGGDEEVALGQVRAECAGFDADREFFAVMADEGAGVALFADPFDALVAAEAGDERVADGEIFNRDFAGGGEEFGAGKVAGGGFYVGGDLFVSDDAAAAEAVIAVYGLIAGAGIRRVAVAGAPRENRVGFLAKKVDIIDVTIAIGTTALKIDLVDGGIAAGIGIARREAIGRIGWVVSLRDGDRIAI